MGPDQGPRSRGKGAASHSGRTVGGVRHHHHRWPGPRASGVHAGVVTDRSARAGDQPYPSPRVGILCSGLDHALHEPRPVAACPPSDAGWHAEPACRAAFVALLVFLTRLGIGVVMRWRWLFWLLLVVFARSTSL